MEDNRLEDRFLIAYFNEEERAQDLFNELILERIEERIVDKLADFYQVVEEEENEDAKEAKSEDNIDNNASAGDKKAKKKKGDKIVLGKKTDIDLKPETSPPHPKNSSPVQTTNRNQVSEGLLGAIVGHFMRNVARNAGVDPKIATAIANHFSRKKVKQPVLKTKKQKSVVTDKPEKKPEQQTSHESEKIDRKEFAKKLKAFGNNLKGMK
jgi:hypothetical protein